MKKAFTEEEKDYLKRCKYSSPETKLSWLASALEFAHETKKMRLKTKKV